MTQKWPTSPLTAKAPSRRLSHSVSKFARHAGVHLHEDQAGKKLPQFSRVCELEASLAGASYWDRNCYKAKFRIVLEFGATSLKAFAEWEEQFRASRNEAIVSSFRTPSTSLIFFRLQAPSVSSPRPRHEPIFNTPAPSPNKCNTNHLFHSVQSLVSRLKSPNIIFLSRRCRPYKRRAESTSLRSTKRRTARDFPRF